MWVEVDEYPSELLAATSAYADVPFVKACSNFYDTYGYLTPRQLEKLKMLGSLCDTDSIFRPSGRLYGVTPNPSPAASDIAVNSSSSTGSYNIQQVWYDEAARNYDTVRSMPLPLHHTDYAYYYRGAAP